MNDTPGSRDDRRDDRRDERLDDRYRDWDASYVLGALPADERLEYERHLAGCPACRESVAELAGMPGILARLSTEDALAVRADEVDTPRADAEQQGADLRRLAHLATRRRRRRRGLVTALAAAAAVVALVGGVALGGSRLSPFAGDTGRTTAATAMSPVGGETRLAADLRITEKPWGTRFDWNCSYGSGLWRRGSAARYDLVVTDDDGRTSTVATWALTQDRAAGLSASTEIDLASIRTVSIRLHGSDRDLVATRV